MTHFGNPDDEINYDDKKDGSENTVNDETTTETTGPDETTSDDKDTTPAAPEQAGTDDTGTVAPNPSDPSAHEVTSPESTRTQDPGVQTGGLTYREVKNDKGETVRDYKDQGEVEVVEGDKSGDDK